MNYDHLYHAGNHADVLKHLTLIALIQALSQKPKPWCYLDTHAGNGIYDFSQVKHLPSPEYKNGVNLIASMKEMPPLCRNYLSMIASLNTKESIRFYPGSTYLVRQLARAEDRLIACELKEEAYEQLKKTFARDKKVAVHHLDGFLGMKGFIPPKEKRGLVLIDPSYEDENEWRQVIESVAMAHSRWQAGHFLLWYPIKDKAHVMGWLRLLRAKIKNEILIIELCPHEAIQDHLYGSGMVVINPIWQFNEQFSPVLAWLWNVLSINKKGYFRQLSIDSVIK